MKLIFKALLPLALTLPTISASVPTAAQIDSRQIEKQSVRVVVKGTDARGKAFAKASSGFLWKQKDQVVTSLHGVPTAANITVSCLGVSRKAMVAHVLKHADLIMLKADSPFSSCTPFTSHSTNKPSEGTKLWTFGWHAGARGGSSRHFEKGYGSPEKLNFLISGASLKTLQTYNIPSTDLDIYYVQGGLLPGYSGGPVVNANRQLVGIVDGGLNKGTSDYNWVIPAKYLDELFASNVKTIPAEVAKMSGLLFSSDTDQGQAQSQVAPAASSATAPLYTTGMVEADANSVVAYEEDGQHYEWVKTKTASLYELGQTADDADGVYQLLNIFGQTAGVTAAEQLVFDVFEDLNLGLIITVPKGQPLEYKFIDDDDWLVSLNTAPSNAFSGIRYDHNGWSVMNAYNQEVAPGDPRYFQDFVAELLIDCHTPTVDYCVLDQSTQRIIDFGGGNKILKLGITKYDYATQKPLQYDYYSFAVRNGIPFGAQAQISAQASAGLIQCMTSTGNLQCANTAEARQELAQLIAVHLTTFSGLANPASGGVLTAFVYDNSADHPNTFQKPFYEGNTLRLYNTRGIQWKLYLDDGTEQVLTEYKAREEGWVFLQQGSRYVSFQEVGGEYFFGENGGDWVKQGELRR